MGAFGDWQKRRAAREARKAGDSWVCPYCKELHPAYEVGGTRFAFGYPSVRFGCCGKVAFMLKDPKTGTLLRFTRIGDGIADWMPKDAYFAYVEEQSLARGHREDSPHQGKITRPEARGGLVTTIEAPVGELSAPAPAPTSSPASPAAARPVSFVQVAKVGEVPKDTSKVVLVNGRRLALFNSNGVFYAIDDACRHAGRSLGEGVFEDGVVTCNGHGWRYDVRSGQAEHNPDMAVQSYPVKVEGDAVLVQA